MLINVLAQARFLIWLKQAYKFYNASSFHQQLPSYASMIKQTQKKHGTTEEHAIDAKKIVFLKDKFIYYSVTY